MKSTDGGGCPRIVSVAPMRGGFGGSRLCCHHPARRVTALDAPPEASKARSRQRWWGGRGIKAKALSVWVGELQAFEHEQHQLLPALEAHVLCEHAQVLKESVAPRQGSTDEGTATVQQLQRRVKQEGQQVQRQQCLGEEQLAMAEIVLKVVALGFEGVDILVFDLPARTGCLHQLFDILLADPMTGDTGGVEAALAILGT